MSDIGREFVPRAELSGRIHTIEEAYEFMLAYAAQGLSGDAAARSDGQVREFLTRMAAALPAIGGLVSANVTEGALNAPEKYAAFHDVLVRDAQASLAAIELVLAQPSSSSQLVDNLNASIHLRALLTDLFLLDEILKNSV